ncbi:hypothetical protein CYMTET_45508 [Cymbomonas tetramitiformis]|uniref:Uncharacterized protein n=1 Tax=Cymbomonas tetramitiformis TaxID=36881 RepID=A0AAE0C055_9CHLO|nr:hypothetical protein CYMTET_45508 [Cymbomonas tetramitiformis]
MMKAVNADHSRDAFQKAQTRSPSASDSDEDEDVVLVEKTKARGFKEAELSFKRSKERLCRVMQEVKGALARTHHATHPEALEAFNKRVRGRLDNPLVYEDSAGNKYLRRGIQSARNDYQEELAADVKQRKAVKLAKAEERRAVKAGALTTGRMSVLLDMTL